MGGALLQLVALGQQDVYLSGNPQITFWKVVFRKHTNFAIESILQTKKGGGDEHKYEISRDADLIHKCYLKVTVPDLEQPDGGDEDNKYITYVNRFGHALIKSVTLRIGGKVVDTHYGEFMHIWNELTMSAEKMDEYSRMIGNFETEMELNKQTKARTYYVPLQFFFCQHPGLSLPLVALHQDIVEINFELENFTSLLRHVNTETELNNDKNYNIEFYVDYVYLDSDEKRLMQQTTHEILMTQLKCIEGSESSTSIELRTLSHPVKELIWVAKPVETSTGLDINKKSLRFDSDGKEIMKSATLFLEGTERVNRDNLFYRFIQPYQHHTRIPNDFIYVYSFALKPEEIQPSGSCNFSRISTSKLNVENNDDIEGVVQYTVYALNWNILSIQTGKGNILFR